MQVSWLFPIKTFDFLEYMQVWWLFPIKFLIFFEYMQVGGTWSSPNLHILKKINILMPKVHKTWIYSKKSKKNDSQKSPNLHILKKNKKKSKFIYASQSHIESEIFDFFEYMQVWWLFTIMFFCFFLVYAGFVHFWHQNVVFFEYMQVWWTSSLKPTCLQPSNDKISSIYFPLSICI